MKTTKVRTRVAAILAAMICATSAVGGSMVSAAEISNAPSTSISASAQTFSSDREELKNYIDSVTKKEVIEANRNKLEVKYDGNERQEATCNLQNNTLTITRVKRTSSENQRENFALSGSLEHTVYPGSIIKLDQNFVNGTPKKVHIDRNDIKYNITCGDKGSFYVNPTNSGDVIKAIKDIVRNSTDDTAANATISYSKIVNEEQIKAELDISADLLKGMNIDFNAIHQGKKTVYIMRYRQSYFNVHVDTPHDVMNLFADSAKKQTLINAGINNQNPMGFVSDVSYGREIYVVITSDNSKTSIASSQKLEGVGFKVAAKEEWESVMKSCKVDAYVRGGKSENITSVAKIKDYNTFMEAIDKDAKFTNEACYVPIEYKVDYLGTNDTVGTKVVGDFWEVAERRTVQGVPLTIRMNAMNGDCFTNIHSGKIVITGRYITGLDENGNYIYGGNYSRSYNYSKAKGELPNHTERDYIPANVDIKTVKVRFDYSGTNDHYFNDPVFSLDRRSGSVTSLVLELAGTNNFWTYTVEGIAWVNRAEKDCKYGETSTYDHYCIDNGGKK